MTDSVAANWPYLYINGRFLTQQQTGVQRFAREVLGALDALLAEPAYLGLRGRAVLVTPPGADPPAKLANLRHLAGGRFGSGYMWEQVDLPRLSADGVLLNLCNLAPIARRQQVVVVHDATTRAKPDVHSRAFRSVYSVILPIVTRRAAKLVTVSEFSRSEISRWYGVPASRLTVCYEGAEHIIGEPPETSILTRYGLIKNRFFLAAGMAGTHKNLPLLLEAFSRARLSDMRLVVTGLRSARVLGNGGLQLPPDVVYVGHVASAELRALYEGALALAFPSSYEGFGLPPLEAMACGCPVVISDQPALVEVAGGAARVCPTGDATELAVALQEVTDPALRARLIKLGLERAQQFTWRATAEHLLAQCRAVGT